MRAKDNMTIDVVTVASEDTIDTAVERMLEHNINGFPRRARPAPR